jgi:DNA-binding FrmR family transcriptional regulator
MVSKLPVPRPSIVRRLKRVEGQVRGIQRMITDERDCADILVQLLAVRSAVAAVAGLVLRNYTHICLHQEKDGEDPAARLARAVAIWVAGRSTQ